VSQGGITRAYGYNGSFFLTSITDPETGVTVFGRDAVGNMTSSTVGGKQTSYGYDGLNRLTSASFPDGQSVGVTYFGNGRARTVTRTGASWTYAYDGNANLTSESLAVGSRSFVVNYTYNANDALASIKYPITNEVVSYNPDGLGRSTSRAHS
jgi:YD repeat-containing protein